jgi:hypothetical protein
MPCARLPHLLRLSALLLCAALTLTACLDAGDAASDATNSTSDTTSADATAREGYPPAPYNNY